MARTGGAEGVTRSANSRLRHRTLQFIAGELASLDEALSGRRFELLFARYSVCVRPRSCASPPPACRGAWSATNTTPPVSKYSRSARVPLKIIGMPCSAASQAPFCIVLSRVVRQMTAVALASKARYASRGSQPENLQFAGATRWTIVPWSMSRERDDLDVRHWLAAAASSAPTGSSHAHPSVATIRARDTGARSLA